MKVIKKADGQTVLSMNREEWVQLGKNNGWKIAQVPPQAEGGLPPISANPAGTAPPVAPSGKTQSTLSKPLNIQTLKTAPEGTEQKDIQKFVVGIKRYLQGSKLVSAITAQPQIANIVYNVFAQMADAGVTDGELKIAYGIMKKIKSGQEKEQEL